MRGSKKVINFGQNQNQITMTRKEIGALLKQKREEQNKTRYRVAEDAGMPITRVKSIEEGKGYHVNSLFDIVEALDLKIVITDVEV